MLEFIYSKNADILNLKGCVFMSSSISGVSCNYWFSKESPQTQSPLDKITNTLNNLVSAGTITQDQEASNTFSVTA